MIKKYQKKPQIIEAIQYTGNNIEEIQNWCKTPFVKYDDRCLGIETLEGIMRANVGDYIIKGIKGEYYPCKQDIFMLTYEEVLK